METETSYFELGTLLTAIIDADPVLIKRKKDRLKSLIQDQLRVKEEFIDSQGRPHTYKGRLVFDESPQPSSTIITWIAFINFIEKNSDGFNLTMKELSLNIIMELAIVYLGTNKLERQLIDQVKRQVKKLKAKTQFA